ncbi:hypothetical protein H5410_023048 [Solanum commersonii]|uniref:SAUR family protein n=1 Tax=Solanum commersonii TaxID=4109 RepID=A0A9J5ZIC7_SOLCO|nr:hypothetical protein H5410_023048 [Solanum commersonii]
MELKFSSLTTESKTMCRCLLAKLVWDLKFVDEASYTHTTVCICGPILYLSQPLLQDLLAKDEEEFDFDHPMGSLTIPCKEDVLVDLMSCM